MKSPQVYAIIREVIGPWAKRVRALSVGLEECSATFVPRTISFILSGSSAHRMGGTTTQIGKGMMFGCETAKNRMFDDGPSSFSSNYRDSLIDSLRGVNPRGTTPDLCVQRSARVGVRRDPRATPRGPVTPNVAVTINPHWRSQ